jgi:protein-tyrosine phosphatase
MIDLHAHVLPGLDDGPRDLADAVALVRASAVAGVRTIAATPHVDRCWHVQPEAIAPAREALRAALAAERVDVEVLGGAEIALDRLVDLDRAALPALALGGGSTLLVEAPLEPMPGDFTWPVRRLLADGWGVLLAHPERSPAFQRRPELLARLVRLGARAQITAGALAGRFGPPARSAGFAMLAEGLADIVASDAHNLVRRPPAFADGRAALQETAPALAARWDAFTHTGPQALLGGDAERARRTAAA